MRLQPVLGVSVAVLLLAGATCVAAGTVLGVMNFRDVGYPDSATLIRVGELVHSGHLYPDIRRPPYYATLYGPLTYLFLAVPYGLAHAAGVAPQVPARLAEVAALLACLLILFSISRRVFVSRPAAWWCVLFAVSTVSLASWTTQIRGDLPGVAVSFLAIYLLLRSAGRGQFIAAAVCSGLAVLVKQTFGAASIAVTCWLIWQRRFKDAAVWLLSSGVTIACGYALVIWREPLALQHLAALRHPLFDYRGEIALILDAVAQPVLPFALLGGFVVLWKRTPEALLLLMYCLTAWLVALLTAGQAGASFNYFWEPLLSSSILAGAGLYELQQRANRISAAGAALLLILLYRAFLPMLGHDYTVLRTYYREAAAYPARKAKWEAFSAAVSGRRLLSTFPDVTILSAAPEVPDPFLNSALERGGTWNSAPVVAALDAGAFDLLVVGSGEAEAPRDYRGLPLWNDYIWRAVKRAYRPACAFDEMEAWTPRTASGKIPPALLAIGCVPLSGPGRN